MSSISSANAVLMLSVPLVFTTPVQLQQFAVDDIFDIDAIEAAETMMGVDGFLTGGYVNVPIKMNLSFMADSPSPPIFDVWYLAQKGVDAFPANAVITLRSLATKWTFTRGFLTSYKPVPDAKKLLQPRKFGLTWQSAVPSPT